MTTNRRLADREFDSSSAIIFVTGLEFYGFHGVPAEERVVGHRYQVDLELTLRTRATLTDDVADSVDYGDVAQQVVRYGQETQFLTVERLGQGLIDLLLDRYSRVDGVWIKVAKLLPPAPVIASAAGIQMYRRRNAVAASDDILESPPR